MSDKTLDKMEDTEQQAPDRVAIEEKLPLTAIDIESQKDMSSGGFHPVLSLHKWFAARPIPASRAAILGSVWPEEADHDELLKLMQMGPKGLDSDIEDHIKRKYSEEKRGKSFEQHYGYANPATQSPTTAQIRSFHETIREGWGGELPTVLDPTSGRGIIPFESLRYGLPTRANELNPIAYLITKIALEYASNIGSLESEVLKYRDKIHQKAKENIQPYYPTEEEGREILNSAFTYILQCDSCAGEIPLVRNWWINKTSGNDAIKPLYENGEVDFQHVVVEDSTDQFDPSDGTVSRGGAECPHCGVIKQTAEIREQIKNDQFEYRIYAVNYKSKSGELEFRAGEEVDSQGIKKAADRVESDFGLIDFLTEPVLEGHNTSQIKRYGIDEWREIYTPRQLITHYEYLEAYNEYASEIREEYPENKSEAILTLLSICSSRVTEFNSRLSRWRFRYGTGSRIFSDNNLAIKFTAVDNNISAQRRGYVSWSNQVIEAYEELVEYLPDETDIETRCGDAADASNHWEKNSIDVAIVDPPYYSSIQYSELSDVFYTILKRYLGDVHPDIFNSQLAEKEKEAVANPSRFEGVTKDGQSEKEMADEKYERKMKDIFSDVRELLVDNGVITLMFTHREMDAWDTLATAFIESGFNITATHPIKTERSDRVGLHGKASADSSILLIGRRQSDRAASKETLWSDVKGKIRSAAEKEAKRILDSGYEISKVDAIITAYGPVLQAYAEEYPVINKKGDPVRPREALAEAREAVTEVIAQRYLNTRGVDSLDSLTRWYILSWLIYETDNFPYDEGNQLGVATGVDINEIKTSTKIWGKSRGDIKLKKPSNRVQDIVLLKDESVDNPSSRKYPVDPTDTRFTYTIDAVHSAIHVYEREGARAAWEWLTDRNLKSDEAFEIAITALLEVLPEHEEMYSILVNLVSGDTGEYLDINLDHIDMSGIDRQTSLGDHT